MQKKNFFTVMLIMAGLIISSCDSYLEPDPANFYSEDDVLSAMFFSEGLLLNGYTKFSMNSYLYPSTDIATDDAVSNLVNDPFTRMAVGEWSSQFNPMSQWNNSYNIIYYMNYFLSSVVDKVEWSWASDERNELFKRRFKGEALGLRAWHNFELLKCHAGKATDGNMLGHILINEPLAKDDNWQLPRNTFLDCVQSIYSDIDAAMELLPMDYVETPNANYNTVFGPRNTGRMSKRILMALKSRVALLVASPAYYPTTLNWEAAAEAAGALLSDIGGISGLSATGHRWYTNANDREIIWRRDALNANDMERNNWPPSVFGSGRMNPTQNLIDAFPMRNGFPISAVNSGYNPNNPYNLRDNRLGFYVTFDNSSIRGTRIFTGKDKIPDGLNQSLNSTRTGYYLKKHMIELVNLAPNVNLTQPHFLTFLRYTEIFLNYAEAANEAWGPIADPKGYGFTATSIIRAIRARAGITPDNYMTTITTKEGMRELIRNERRIELCFEGVRFWDLRRWDLNLTEDAKGIRIETNAGINTYTVFNVDPRPYKPYMKYGPIPYSEILKNSNLLQNEGW